MPQHYQHEPAEGYGRMHIAQQRLPLPDLCMEEAVAEQVPYVLAGGDRIQQRSP